MAVKKTETVPSIVKIQQGSIPFRIVGTTPLVLNRMAEKARQQLLLPTPRKTAADRAGTLKHYPLEEYRSSMYRRAANETGPTELVFPGSAFRRAIASAALVLPGLKKTETQKLTWVEEMNVSIFGIPQLFMSVVRSADMNKTPDIRTRAIVPHWAAELNISFVTPLTKPIQVVDLMNAAGMVIGIGDGRQEKGALSMGQFRVVDEDDHEFSVLKKGSTRKAQLSAIEDPAFYDAESEELYSWFVDEVKKREGAAPTPKKKKAA